MAKWLIGLLRVGTQVTTTFVPMRSQCCMMRDAWLAWKSTVVLPAELNLAPPTMLDAMFINSPPAAGTLLHHILYASRQWEEERHQAASIGATRHAQGVMVAGLAIISAALDDGRISEKEVKRVLRDAPCVVNDAGECMQVGNEF